MDDPHPRIRQPSFSIPPERSFIRSAPTSKLKEHEDTRFERWRDSSAQTGFVRGDSLAQLASIPVPRAPVMGLGLARTIELIGRKGPIPIGAALRARTPEAEAQPQRPTSEPQLDLGDMRRSRSIGRHGAQR